MTASPFAPDEIAAEGIKPEEYEEIVQRLGRHPNKAELGMFGVMWSEHCCYKNSRPLLKNFPTEGERILVGPGENAGVVDLGDGLRLAFKIESHNHPSAVEPFQGAATGVGGILRDIFTMGARPIAILNALRFGNLDDARNRRIFMGVVDGISHYGNCLIASETFIWRDKQGVHVDTIGNFTDQHLPEGWDTYELAQGDRLETLSFDPETGESCWQPIKRLFKRTTETLITLKTPMGRQITVTPDHPTCVVTDQGWETKPAQDVKEGDRLPILLSFPHTDHYLETIDCIQLLQTLPNEHLQNVYVQLPKTWQPTEVLRQAFLSIESSASSRHRYLNEGYFPFEQFLQVESLLNVQRDELRLYKRSGKANYMKAVIRCNESFARLLGYFLSEGCVSQHGNTYKIIFTFAPHETEYLEDVKQALAELGLNPRMEERESTTVVYATSWLLGWLLSDVWHCGQGAASKQMPSFVFQWYKILQREVIRGLIRGDGSFSNKTKGSHAKITYATTSDCLFRQVVLLLQDLGVVPYTYLRPARSGQIQGREYKGLPIWQLEISNLDNLTTLRGIFSEERNALLDEALAKYNGDTYSFPRYKVEDQIATVAVKEIEIKALEPSFVYDVEVENTHLFVTTSGLITHNCVGVPTVGGEIYFDPAYSGNPLVNAMALGLMETEEIVKAGAAGIGNPVLYVGSTTGRDGMGGASFASAELTDQSMDDRPAVQVGDPFLEKSLIEACLEAFKSGAVVAAQDMGAAGITCSTSEMAAKGGVGIELDLDKIPVRETGMVPYEYLLSESQERMLFVAQPGREQELIDIFHRWGLQAVVAGQVIAEPIVRIFYQGGIAAEIPATALADNTPIYHRELLETAPDYAQTAWQWQADQLPPATLDGIEIKGERKTWNEVLLTLLDTPSIASKRWVYRQYDHQVQNNTVILPGGADAAVVRVRPIGASPSESGIGVAATTDCNARYVYLNPLEGAKAAVAEAARNLSCVGADPLAVTDNLNFGSPENPVGYWQLALACQGIAEACRELNTPVTGGNVSLYNETLDSNGKPQAIYPTPVIGMVGRVADISKVVGQGWRNTGDGIYLLGSNDHNTLGGSDYLAVLHHTVAGQPPQVDFALEKVVQAACRYGIAQGWITAAHDCAEGGLAVALAEMAIAGKRGAEIVINLDPQRFDQLLFGESASRIVVTVNPQYQSEWEQYLQENLNNTWQKLGTVGTEQGNLTLLTAENTALIDLDLAALTEPWETAIARRLTVQH